MRSNCLIQGLFRALAAVAMLALPASAQMTFVPFGARSLAMGGVSVALDQGTVSAADNPATVENDRFSAALTAGGVANESGDFIEPLEIVTGNSRALLAGGAANLGDVAAALRKLAEPGNGILGQGVAGAVAVSRGWALSLTQSGWAGAFVRADLVHVAPGTDPATSVLGNTSAAAFRALTVQDLALTNSRTFAKGMVSVGASAHVLRGTTLSKEEDAFSTEVGDALQMARRGLTGVERTSVRFSFDVGALVKFGPVRVGAVVRAVNRPSFPFDAETGPLADRGAEVAYGRQARVGASVHFPVVGITLAVDADVLKSDTMIPGLQSQEIGGGAEMKLGPLAFRGGVAVNLESPDETKRFSAGIGVSVGLVKADAAVVYRPDRSALGAVLTARVGI